MGPLVPSWFREGKVREIQVTQDLSLQEARVSYAALHMDLLSFKSMCRKICFGITTEGTPLHFGLDH
jgi:hypothetical protein